MAKLVCNRLSEPDCRLNGQILSDFPVTAQQFEFMEKAGHLPTHAVYKDFSHKLMHGLRKTFFYDPILNRVVNYTHTQLDELKPDMRKRLIGSTQYAEKCVEIRYNSYIRNKESMIKQCKKKGLSVIESAEDEGMDMVREKLEKDMD